MSAITGTWDLRMRTPIGSIRAELTFREAAGELRGEAVGAEEAVALQHVSAVPEADGEHVTWSQSITKPMRLHLDFDVVVRGDELQGHSRAGRLPRSSVTGVRLR